ncbi:efflux RND transporter periplasmic adaptor subunit [Rubinisphaera italica]|uniref:CzcB-like barrel-sandwich hybrid domain-containing protein n=1 Tax=Rubinisphaera italica TaxID=2527969 RepID=A0A5C5XD36_9PLAN|nr:HlyD family efflux transporter periplasmic adaptor subunit [Rubinisphaera italica]TWT59832.1 hypothetical protein Pan54_05430 [Rubinisphaera italica]HBN79050.1 hypothetical protein [Planctomycetaceae bacterium]
MTMNNSKLTKILLIAFGFAISGELSIAEDRERILVDNCSIAPLNSAKIASDRPGVLELISVEEGDEVDAKQQIARLRDDVATAAVEISRKQTENDIEIRLAQKTSEVAAAELEQAVQANSDPNLQVVTRYEIRRLKLSAEQTQLQIEQAEHDFAVKKLELIESEERLKEHQILTPISGMVVRRFKTSGEAVQQGTEIAEVVNFQILKVEGFINVADSWEICQGDPVVVRLESPNLSSKIRDMTFNGNIRFIDGAVTPVTEKIRIWAEVRNEGNKLKPGLRATLEIMPSTKQTDELSE